MNKEEKAAFQGHILSQKNVGAAYWNGDGVEKNLEECVFWYELAANGGDAQAQFATGWFLMTGTGVPKDERMGLKWIHKATFQGFQPAIDYYYQNEQYDGLVFLTDGYAPTPKVPDDKRHKPIAWILTTQGGNEANLKPIGPVVRITGL